MRAGSAAPGPSPRAAGPGFTPYHWAASASEVAARHGVPAAHVLRFDANLPPFPARLPSPPGTLLAERGEYPEGTYRRLREAAAAYAGCGPDEIVVDAGADGLIGLVARTFLGPGRRAVVETPTYPLYAIASRIEGAEVEAAAPDVETLARAARDAHVLWLCNPGNPSGALRAVDEVATLAAVLPRVLVCVDEAYVEYGGETVASLAPTRPNLVCVRTLSKAFGLAGLRVGYAVATAAVAAELASRRAPAPISTVGALTAACALQEPAIAAEVETTRRERERVRSACLAAGYDSPPTHTNFVLVETHEAPAIAARLEARGLVVRAYPTALRITVRSPADDDLLLRALDVAPPPATIRSATLLGPGLRVSVVLEGSGRVRVETGDAERDERLERSALADGLDLELVADGGTDEGTLERHLREALAVAAR
ncbi:MAG: histidinol-phosphate aminotransferase family protein [Thermoleophilia bacterium]|nr:histidinol-phosphate aminotransferase family protein [Thermoleophilia bacterium]